MRKYLPKGFTMIELLVVIAVIGILAVAVLAAINPIEQINRGRDTGSQSDSEQLIGAIDRFYAQHEYYPWMESPDDIDGEATPTGWEDAATIADSDGCLILDKLGIGAGPCVGSQEVKAGFTARLVDDDYNTIYLFNRGLPGDSVYACFMAKSGSFQTESTSRCTDGDYGLDFPSTDACDHIPDCGTAAPADDCSCLP